MLLEQVLEAYGATLPYGRGGWQRIRCFMHDDKTPSASVNFDEDRFYCFTCSVSEDALGLIMRMENVDFVGAKRIAQERFGASDDGVPETRSRGRRVSPRKGTQRGNSGGGSTRIRVRARGKS